jgi:hypothetical protein
VNYLVGVFIVGLFACISAGNAYPLVDANSVALLLLAGWFIGLLVLRRAAKNRDGNDSEGSLPPKHCFAIAFAPWFVCALLVLNAKADSSTPTYRATEVQAMSTGKGGPSVRIVPWRRRRRDDLDFREPNLLRPSDAQPGNHRRRKERRACAALDFENHGVSKIERARNRAATLEA